MRSLAILDLGYGNTRSVAIAFERIGLAPTLAADPAAAAGADRLVLPGVGAAAPAMARLRETGLDALLRQWDRPLLGICLGMQLLFERSEEGEGSDLLGLLPGDITPLEPAPGYPVPHMGWSPVTVADADLGLSDGDYLYFAHSYRCPPGDFTRATARYGAADVPAAVRRGKLWGVQFHPERSSRAGARLLEAFANA